MSERGRAERPLFFSANKNKSAGRTLESIDITVKTNCGKAIVLVSSWKNPQYSGCKI